MRWFPFVAQTFVILIYVSINLSQNEYYAKKMATNQSNKYKGRSEFFIPNFIYWKNAKVC